MKLLLKHLCIWDEKERKWFFYSFWWINLTRNDVKLKRKDAVEAGVDVKVLFVANFFVAMFIL